MSIDKVHGSGAVTATTASAETSGGTDAADGSLLPSVVTASVSTGDPSAAIAALLVKIGQGQEQTADAVRKASEQTEDNEESQQVDLMHQKADGMAVGAWFSGALALGSAATSFASVGAMNLTDGSPSATLASKYWDAGSKLLDASSKLVGGLSAASEAGTDAEVTEAQHAGEHAKRAGDDAKSDADDAQKYVDKALDFYSQYQTAKAQTMAAALHRS